MTEMDAGAVLPGESCRLWEPLMKMEEPCLTRQLFCWGTGGSCHPPASQEPPWACPKGSPGLVAPFVPAENPGATGNLPREKLQEAFFGGTWGEKTRKQPGCVTAGRDAE